MIKPIIWIKPGIIAIYGSGLDAAPHSHHAMQVIWPENNSRCKFNDNDISELLIIDSKIEHQLQLSKGWVLLIEPKSVLGRELSITLAGEPFITVNSPLFMATEQPTQTNDLSIFLAPLLKVLNITIQSLLINESTVEDQRIQQILTELNKCLDGDCIKPSNWRAAKVAHQLALSESRFLHLFSQELGISWRPYLLWRRMICAIQAMKNNHCATDAAHLAGFSDSAHLSRTFRNTFGMTIRQAHVLFREG